MRSEGAAMKSRLVSTENRLGLSRDVAAEYVGVGVNLFDQMVADGRMPKPRPVNSRRLWSRFEIEKAFASLPEGQDEESDESIHGGKRGPRCSPMKYDFPFLMRDVDRYGRIRFYLRKGRLPKIRLDGAPGDPEFLAEYQAALERARRRKTSGRRTARLVGWCTSSRRRTLFRSSGRASSARATCSWS